MLLLSKALYLEVLVGEKYGAAVGCTTMKDAELEVPTGCAEDIMLKPDKFGWVSGQG